ncbi:unnamed protein product [Schistocephalus solidus]|uniref:Uncharacterized protein n=1 Tax=Schistocephalus solidus TaxID=70667 RepID=A0A183TAU9_SCHSO|nr:unnamed protein product [Schistocephalus solidus]
MRVRCDCDCDTHTPTHTHAGRQAGTHTAGIITILSKSRPSVLFYSLSVIVVVVVVLLLLCHRRRLDIDDARCRLPARACTRAVDLGVCARARSSNCYCLCGRRPPPDNVKPFPGWRRLAAARLQLLSETALSGSSNGSSSGSSSTNVVGNAVTYRAPRPAPTPLLLPGRPDFLLFLCCDRPLPWFI